LTCRAATVNLSGCTGPLQPRRTGKSQAWFVAAGRHRTLASAGTSPMDVVSALNDTRHLRHEAAVKLAAFAGLCDVLQLSSLASSAPAVLCMLQAVIGAGVAGLVAVKELLREGHRVTVFEQDDDIGGVWKCVLGAPPWHDIASCRPYPHHQAMHAWMHQSLTSETLRLQAYPLRQVHTGC
jgi:heterodisulfide reductase subunit A-like polyferredoxin